MKVLLFAIALSVASSVWADVKTDDDELRDEPRLSEILPGKDSLEATGSPQGNLPQPIQVGPSVWELKPLDEQLETNLSSNEENEKSCVYDRDHMSKVEQEYKFMQAIQLGIAASLKHSRNVVDDSPIELDDYQVFETIAFKKITEDHTPGPFKFQALAPYAFTNFRKIFNVTDEQYQRSIGDESTPLKILGNPGGVSSSSFYMTHDGLYIIKTMQQRESKLLSHILPKYYSNMKDGSQATLLPKFFGQYCYISPGFGGKNVCFMVMNNLLPTNLGIHQKYDLKGSTVFRRAPQKELAKSLPAYRDLDFLEQHETGFLLDSGIYDELLKSIKADIKLLAYFKIMDYSLLVGVYKLDESGDYPPGVQVTTLKSLRESTNSWAAIPAMNSRGEMVLLFMGIIDILQTFRVTKRLEFAFKAIVFDRNEVSVTEPNFYAQRFRDFMATKVFTRLGGHQPRTLGDYVLSAEVGDDFGYEDEPLFDDIGTY